MTKRHAAIAAVFAIALVLPPSPAAAQAQADDAAERAQDLKKESSAHFQRGAELFQEGLYRAALVELQRAYELTPNYRVLYNIGQTHIALGEFVSAIRAFEGLLAQGGNEVDRKRQAEVRAQIADLTKRTGTLSVRVEGGEATVTVDGVGVGSAPIERMPVDVGRRQLVASGANGATASAEVDIAGGDLKEVSLTLEVPVADKLEELLRGKELATPARSRRKKWGIGMLSGGAALALTGMGMAFSANAARDDYEDARAVFPGDEAEINGAHDRLIRHSMIADALFIGAGAFAATGLVLLVIKDREKDEGSASAARFRLALTPRALIAEGQF